MRTAISHSLSLPPKLFNYVHSQSVAKKRSFSSEVRDLIEYGLKARDGAAVLNQLQEAPRAYVKKAKKAKTTKAPE